MAVDWFFVLWQRLRKINESIAATLKTTSWHVLQLEILGFGFTMIQIGEYAAAVACWVVLAILWVRMVSDVKSDVHLFGSFGKFIHSGFAVAICVLLITITNLHRDDKNWSNLQKIWKPKPPAFAIGIDDQFMSYPLTYWWTVDRGQLCGIKVVLFLRLVNLQASPTSISHFEIAMKRKNGEFVRFPQISGGKIYTGVDTRKASPLRSDSLHFLEEDIGEKSIQPHAPVRALVFLDTPNDFTSFDEFLPGFRVTVQTFDGVEFSSYPITFAEPPLDITIEYSGFPEDLSALKKVDHCANEWPEENRRK
jgi:hypothetical protein